MPIQAQGETLREAGRNAVDGAGRNLNSAIDSILDADAGLVFLLAVLLVAGWLAYPHAKRFGDWLWAGIDWLTDWPLNCLGRGLNAIERGLRRAVRWVTRRQ